MDFLRKQHRQPAYERAPVRVERHHPRDRSLFGSLFDELRRDDRRDDREKPRVQKAERNMQRVVCRRACDGAQLVLGIVPASKSHKQEEAMCTAAGGGEPTELVVEKFVPGAGFAPPEPVQTASAAAPLLEGRAALGDNSEPRIAPDRCEDAVESRFMTVPILHDATLRKGDVVATRDGFKVFVGKGKPPFEDKDFVSVDKRKRIASDVRHLKISNR